MPRVPMRLCAIALFSCLAVSGLCAQTAPDGKRKLPTSVKFHKAPSEESPAAREKRLKRECKGRPNAGMCAGFTR
ncbi:hypothetical protein [Hydrogenophaga sp. BPS33]|uniref:hypothetical protein n=1 Tax=Hydrogenophaga sp. BPS33 TaxID=2651974 RepID=UPI0013204E0C|nr:hypothetical protein [Hydrogenophaga sp. BPS33]QHE83661.1 hypothetical protein F9K07_01600 [Hydrogenophaga sp. BPS33]